MKRILVVLAALTFSIGVAAPAQAANAHFISGPTATVSGNTLTVTGSVAGLGNASGAKFTLSGDVVVSSRCFTKSGNKPQAANKQETIAVSDTKTFNVRNGRTNFTFTVTPLSTLTCPKGQIAVIESVTFNNLRITGEGLNALVPQP